MLLGLLGTGYDPLDDPVVAEYFGKGHPALEYIRDWGFDWPNTRVVPITTGSTVTTGLRERCPLKILGYTAGANGRSQQDRRYALSRAFCANFHSDSRLREFMPEWGEPQSGKRLQKIAVRISMNVDPLSAGGRRPEAVRHWREDLQWLKATFYDGKHTFSWPSTNVS